MVFKFHPLVLDRETIMTTTSVIFFPYLMHIIYFTYIDMLSLIQVMDRLIRFGDHVHPQGLLFLGIA